MMENLILILIAFVVLAFLSLLWLRQSVLHTLKEVKHKEDILKKDYEKRRDMLPYFLESIRKSQDPDDTWHKLLQDRAFFHSQDSWEKEQDLENTLKKYMQNADVHGLTFLEAKKDLEEMNALIDAQKTEVKEAADRYKQKRKEFPYSLASGIFGFPL